MSIFHVFMQVFVVTAAVKTKKKWVVDTDALDKFRAELGLCTAACYSH